MKQTNFISQSSKKNLLGYLSQSRKELKDESIRELNNNPILRSEGEVTLYRGINMRSNGDVVLEEKYSHNKNTPSSWSHSQDTAERFAKYGYFNANSSILANFYVGLRDGQIDNDLGIVIKYTFTPKDILVDLDKVPNKLPNEFAYEKEVIVNACDVKCDVVKIFTNKSTFNSVEEFNNRDLSDNYQEVLNYYKERTVGIYPELKKMYDDFSLMSEGDFKEFIRYLMKLDIEKEIANLYKKFIDIYQNRPELIVYELGGNSDFHHELKMIDKCMANFSDIYWLGYQNLSNWFYEREVLKQYFNKNIDRMKPENARKLEKKFKQKEGISIEEVGKKYSLYNTLMFNSVFSMKNVSEKIL